MTPLKRSFLLSFQSSRVNPGMSVFTLEAKTQHCNLLIKSFCLSRLRSRFLNMFVFLIYFKRSSKERDGTATRFVCFAKIIFHCSRILFKHGKRTSPDEFIIYIIFFRSASELTCLDKTIERVFQCEKYIYNNNMLCMRFYF